MTLAAIVFTFGGSHLTTFFTGDWNDPAGELTANLLKIVAISTPALGIVQILTGLLRGAGDTRVPLLVTFVGLLVLRIPLACWLAWEQFTVPGTGLVLHGWGWGIEGAWCAMVIDVTVRAAMVTFRFWQGGWKTIKV